MFGGAAVYFVARFIESLLFKMDGRDPFVFTVSIGLLALIAFIAGLVPAIRASRIDPMKALRYE